MLVAGYPAEARLMLGWITADVTSPELINNEALAGIEEFRKERLSRVLPRALDRHSSLRSTAVGPAPDGAGLLDTGGGGGFDFGGAYFEEDSAEDRLDKVLAEAVARLDELSRSQPEYLPAHINLVTCLLYTSDAADE